MKIQFRGGDVYQIFIRLIEEKVEIQFGVSQKQRVQRKSERFLMFLRQSLKVFFLESICGHERRKISSVAFSRINLIAGP